MHLLSFMLLFHLVKELFRNVAQSGHISALRWMWKRKVYEYYDFAAHNSHSLLTNITLKKTESCLSEKAVTLPAKTSCVCSPEEIYQIFCCCYGCWRIDGELSEKKKKSDNASVTEKTFDR